MGEIMFRGNITMKGYLKNPRRPTEAFRGGWFHSGDLAVMQPDGYAKIKDRSKDVIISGGENISSQEVEDVLHGHPAVMMAAVVAQPTQVGRDAVRVHRAEGGRLGSAEEIDRVLPRAHGALQGAQGRCLRATAEDLDGKIQKFLLRERAKSTTHRVKPAANDRSEHDKNIEGSDRMREGQVRCPRSARVPLDALHGVGRARQPACPRVRARPHAQRPRLRLPRRAHGGRLPRGCPTSRAAAAATGCAIAADYNYPVTAATWRPSSPASTPRPCDWVGHLDGRHHRHDPRGHAGSPVSKLVMNDVGCSSPRRRIERIGSTSGASPRSISIEALEARSAR
jgi:hypothetical protein